MRNPKRLPRHRKWRPTPKVYPRTPSDGQMYMDYQRLKYPERMAEMDAMIEKIRRKTVQCLGIPAYLLP